MKEMLRRIVSGKYLIALLAAVMILTAGIGSANAYFTTYAEAQGGIVLRLGDRTDIEERFSEWTKHIVIDSLKGSEPVWVRVKAFCGSEYSLHYSWDGNSWSENIADQGTGSVAAADDEGWYYCTSILYGNGEVENRPDAGGQTDEILIRILDKDGNEIKADKDSQAFNVVVIYESTPVLYDADGNAYADWTKKLEPVIVDGSVVTPSTESAPAERGEN